MDLFNKVRCQGGCSSKLILFHHSADKLTPYQMLVESTKKAGLQLYLKRTGNVKENLFEHIIQIGEEIIVTDFAESNKSAREILGPKAIKALQETCFTIKVKENVTGYNVTREELMLSYDQNNSISGKIFGYLDYYVNDNAIYNLIFPNQFSTEERKMIYDSALKLKLKAKSLGKAERYQVVVSKKLGLWEIAEYLMQCNDESVGYELVLPTNIDKVRENYDPKREEEVKKQANNQQAKNNKRKRLKSDEQGQYKYNTQPQQQQQQQPRYQNNHNQSSSYNNSYYNYDQSNNSYSNYNNNSYNNYSSYNNTPPSYNNYNNMQNYYSMNQHYSMQRQYNMVSKNQLQLQLSDIYLLNKARQQPGCRSKLILFENVQANLSPYQMLVESAQKAQLEVRLIRTGNTKDTLFEYSVQVGEETIVSDFAEHNKHARDILGPKALQKLQESCFTVVVKTQLRGRPVNRADIEKINPDEQEYNDNFYENRGVKMMRRMGWNGQGLGRYNYNSYERPQGPITVKENLRHFGLSYGKDNSLDNIQSKIMKYLEDYVKNPCTYNLVFSNEFSIDERKIIHESCLKLKLKSKSFGKLDHFQLVVSKKLSPWELVEHLLACRDSSANHQLKRPTSMMIRPPLLNHTRPNYPMNFPRSNYNGSYNGSYNAGGYNGSAAPRKHFSFGNRNFTRRPGMGNKQQKKKI